MKILTTLIVLSALTTGCRQLLNRDSVKNFAAGTYVASWHTRYSQSNDTIRIAPGTTNGSNVFLITRHMLTAYSGNGKKRPPAYKVTKWTGVYINESKTIMIQNNGRILSFNPDEKKMTMGVTVYKKI